MFFAYTLVEPKRMARAVLICSCVMCVCLCVCGAVTCAALLLFSSRSSCCSCACAETHAIRNALTKHQQGLTTLKAQKKAAYFPTRKYAIKA